MLFDDSYKVLSEGAEIKYTSKGSKFLAYAYPVRSEDEVKQQLNNLRQKYPDASHHCYAYILHHDKSASRSNDDGEPAGTAGKPILRQIQKLELTNTLVVVVRYFGGTLLGVPGLIEAYGESAGECLALCKTNTHTIMEKYIINCPFGDEKDVYRLAKQFNIHPSPMPETSCFSAEIKIPLHKVALFKAALKDYYRITTQYTGVE